MDRRDDERRSDDDRDARSVDHRDDRDVDKRDNHRIDDRDGRQVDDRDGRYGDDDRVAADDRETVAGETGATPESSESDRPADTERPDAEAAAGDHPDLTTVEAAVAPIVTAVVPAPEEHVASNAGEDGTAGTVEPSAPIESSAPIEPVPAGAGETMLDEARLDTNVIDDAPVESDGGGASDVRESTVGQAEGATTGPVVHEGEPPEVLPDNAPAVDGEMAGMVPAHRSPSDGRPVEEPTDEPSDQTHDAENEGTALFAAAAGVTAAGRATADPAGQEVAPKPDSHSPTAASDVAGPDRTAGEPAGEPAGGTTAETDFGPATSPETTEAPDPAVQTDDQLVTGDADPIDQQLGLGDDRPANGLAPMAPARTLSSTPARTQAPVATPTSASELVELQTTGLAERLRPAFAAVRRGLNGLDELRLRIQDDNAGPIKVDISTIDNRVRVLLSAGNDDLMRQLGQERERLADELRRAGFEQASIDIGSQDKGRRNGGYEEEVSGGPGSGATGRGGSGAATSVPNQHRSRVNRELTGLDLDL